MAGSVVLRSTTEPAFQRRSACTRLRRDPARADPAKSLDLASGWPPREVPIPGVDHRLHPGSRVEIIEDVAHAMFYEDPHHFNTVVSDFVG